jgi:ABC-2 type transport system ATP-binding protein
MNGISLKNVSFRYGAKVALHEISLDIAQGQFCALLGPNGAGKSTLFALLTNLFVPQAGSIFINGFDVAKSPRNALGQIGVVFQQSTLDQDLNVLQNLEYFAALQGLSPKDANRRIMSALEALNVIDRAYDTVRTLNGGHRRRVEIARSLIHDPAVLLLDEPTVGLDPQSRVSITNDVHELAKTQRKTILWATHLTDEVMCNSVADSLRRLCARLFGYWCLRPGFVRRWAYRFLHHTKPT